MALIAGASFIGITLIGMEAEEIRELSNLHEELVHRMELVDISYSGK